MGLSPGRPRPVGITGIGIFLPEKVLTNADLERVVDTSDEWIIERTGIRERRIADEGMVTSDLAVRAARQALDEAGVAPAEVDLIIVARVLPDMPFPATACFVQDKLGAVRAAAFDIVAGCTGFLFGLAMATPLIAMGVYDTALVIGAEFLSKILDWTDRSTCVLLGDAGGAAVLRPVSEGRGVLANYMGTDGGAADLLIMPAGGSANPPSHETVEKRMHYFKMNGREVFKRAGKVMAEACMRVLDQAGYELKDVDLLVPHQANLRIITSLADRLKFPLEKTMINIQRYGNISAASIPVALREALQEGRLKDGDLVLMVSFGTGLTWAASLIRWGS